MKTYIYLIYLILVLFNIVLSKNIKNSDKKNYLQEYASNSIFGEKKVNQNAGKYGAEQTAPSICVDRDGSFITTWIDYRNGGRDVYYQRFTSEGHVIDDNIKVNEDGNEVFNYAPTAAFLDSGSFIIVWPSNGKSIYAQKFNSKGQRIGSNLIINNYSQWNYNCNSPSIASDSNGNFMVVWLDEYLRGKIFSNDLKPKTEEINISNEYFITSFSSTSRPIASSENGQFVIVWSGRNTKDKTSNIFLQSYDNEGKEISENILVSQMSDSTVNYFPSISKLKNNNFVIAWESWKYEFRADYSYITAQRYSIDDGLIGNNIFVNERDSNRSSNFSSVCSLNDDDFLVSWRNGSLLSARRFDSNGVALSNDFYIKLDSKIAYPYWPSVSSDTSGNYVFVWEDMRFGTKDIFIQKYDKFNNPYGSNIKATDDGESSFETDPAIIADEKKNYLVAWNDKRDGFSQVYAQPYSANGNPIGPNIKISYMNENNQFYGSLKPTIRIDNKGNYVIAWIYNYNIFIQKLSQEGKLIGDNLKITDQNFREVNQIDIKFNSINTMFIIWDGIKFFYNNIQSGYKIGVFGRKFREDGFALTDVKDYIIFDYNKPDSPIGGSFAVNNDWQICYFWNTYNSSVNSFDNEIKAQLVSSEGEIIGETRNIPIIRNNETFYSSYLRTASDSENNFLVSWMNKTDFNDYVINISRIDPADSKMYDGSLLFDSLSTTTYVPFFRNMISDNSNNLLFVVNYNNKLLAQVTDFSLSKIMEPFILIEKTQTKADNHFFYYDKGEILYTWQDSKEPGKGYDIYMNKTSLLELEYPEGLSEYKLFQNYPNPFNSNTVFSYNLAEDAEVNITVYNLLGEKVKDLINSKMNKGLHQINFNASNLTSGVYFVRLSTGKYNCIIKAILIK